MKQDRVISGAVAAWCWPLCWLAAAPPQPALLPLTPPRCHRAAGSEATAPTAEPQTEAALPDACIPPNLKPTASMVHANEACDGKGTLTVADGKMTFHVSLASKNIVNLYLGTAEDAPSHESDWLQPTTDTVTYSDGTSDEVYGYDIPLDAVDTDFQLAIWAPRHLVTTIPSACAMPSLRPRMPLPKPPLCLLMAATPALSHWRAAPAAPRWKALPP